MRNLGRAFDRELTCCKLGSANRPTKTHCASLSVCLFTHISIQRELYVSYTYLCVHMYITTQTCTHLYILDQHDRDPNHQDKTSLKIIPCPVLCCRVLLCPVLLCLVLSCLSCLVLSWLVLSCAVCCCP